MTGLADLFAGVQNFEVIDAFFPELAVRNLFFLSRCEIHKNFSLFPVCSFSPVPRLAAVRPGIVFAFVLAFIGLFLQRSVLVHRTGTAAHVSNHADQRQKLDEQPVADQDAERGDEPFAAEVKATGDADAPVQQLQPYQEHLVIDTGLHRMTENLPLPGADLFDCVSKGKKRYAAMNDQTGGKRIIKDIAVGCQFASSPSFWS